MNNPVARPPAAVAVGLALAVVLDTFVQITWKLATAGIPAGASTATALRTVLVNPLFLAAMLAFAAQLWNWLRVLARADLSFAQPFTALSYLAVLGISARWLHEQVSPSRWAGVALIIVGVSFISRTPFRTGNHGGSAGAGDGPVHP